MLAGRLYHVGRDGIVHLCIEHHKKEHYLIASYIAIGGIHMAENQIIRRVLWARVLWPTIMRAEVHYFVMHGMLVTGNQDHMLLYFK